VHFHFVPILPFFRGQSTEDRAAPVRCRCDTTTELNTEFCGGAWARAEALGKAECNERQKDAEQAKDAKWGLKRRIVK
jgi:hypothetical protein